MIDMGVTTSGDVTISAGDFVMAESTAEHQKELLLNNKGDYKQNPAVGVGVLNYMDDDDGFTALTRQIAQQFAADGMQVNSVVLQSNGTIKTDAYYP